MKKRNARILSAAWIVVAIATLSACATGGGGGTVSVAGQSADLITPWPSGGAPFPSSGATPTPTGNPTSNPTGSPTGNPTSNPTFPPSSAPTPTPSGPTPVPTPTPTSSSVPIHIPIPTPTPAPTGTPLFANPFFPNGGSGTCATGIILSLSASQTADVTISEPGYSGSWSVGSNTNPAAATAVVDGQILAITPLATGATTIGVNDQANNASPCSVTVQP